MAAVSLEHSKNPTTAPESPVLYIVDDEPELLDSLAKSLRMFGYSPIPFSNPVAMLAAAKEHEVGCVVTDLRMPEIGGIELQKRLAEKNCCLSVILLTAFADVPTTVDAMKRGAVTVVQKPFELQVLAAGIEDAFAESQQRYSDCQQTEEAQRLLSKLTPDEVAVLDLAIEGTPNREIAEQLGVSPRTVDRRRQSGLKSLAADCVSEYAILKTIVGSPRVIAPEQQASSEGVA